MNKKKKSNLKFVAVSFAFIALLGILFFKDQVKITVVNSFSETYADSENYHVLEPIENQSQSFQELAIEGKKTFIFVTSNWCSLCDALAVKLKENTKMNPDYIVYEADIDQYRSELGKFQVTSSPSLILLNGENYKILNDLSFSDLEQVLSTELN